MREALEKVDNYTHPDPYVFNYMPGGTKFMRNAPIPLEVRVSVVVLFGEIVERCL